VKLAAHRVALEQERDFLLASLDELDAELAAGELDDGAHRELRAAYTTRAAAVLKALEGAESVNGESVGGEAPDGEARSAAVSGRRAVRAGGSRHFGATLAVAGTIVVAVATAVVFYAGERGSNSLTGTLPGSSQGMDPAMDMTPGDGGLDGRVARALQLERTGDAVGALKLYDEALAAKPDNAEALAYRGWLLKRAGLSDRALDSLNRAVAADPTYPDAHFFRGMLLYQDRADPAGAVAEFKLFLDNDPPPAMVPMVENVMRRAMADSGKPPPP